MKSQHSVGGWSLVVAFVVIGYMTIGGCQQQSNVVFNSADEHEDGDAHEHDLTFAQAVGKIKELRNSIRTAFADGRASEVDGDVHEIAHILNEITDLAAHEQFEDDIINEIKQASDRMFEAYDQLDALIHRGADAVDVTYDDVADDVESGIATLEAKLSLIEMDAEHDHGENGDHAVE